MLWVYGYYTFLVLSVQGSTLDVWIWRKFLTSEVDPRAEKVKITFIW